MGYADPDEGAEVGGNSLGIVLPKEIIEREGIKENDEIIVLSVQKRKTAEVLCGTLKGWNVDTQKLRDEFRRQEWEAEERKQRLLSR